MTAIMERVSAGGSVAITWLGHACFRIDWQRPSGHKVVVLIDPVPATLYPAIDIRPNVVLVSHPHDDHSAVPPGRSLVVRGVTDDCLDWQRVRVQYRRLGIKGIGTYHDRELGGNRGKNMAFVIQAGDIRLAHLGDLGHPLTSQHVKELAGLELLMVPVGGHFTIGPEQAWDIIDRVQPRVAIPMHYRTDRIASWPLFTVAEFLGDKEYRQVSGTVTVTRDRLPESTEVWVFECP